MNIALLSKPETALPSSPLQMTTELGQGEQRYFVSVEHIHQTQSHLPGHSWRTPSPHDGTNHHGSNTNQTAAMRKVGSIGQQAPQLSSCYTSSILWSSCTNSCSPCLGPLHTKNVRSESHLQWVIRNELHLSSSIIYKHSRGSESQLDTEWHKRDLLIRSICHFQAAGRDRSHLDLTFLLFPQVPGTSDNLPVSKKQCL